MAKTLKRDVYLDGFLLPAGTELTEDQAERITNPNATEDLAIEGQDGRKAAEQQRVKDGYPTGEPAAELVRAEGESPLRKPAGKTTSR